ncbi:transducin-like enhancer protein 6 [Ctenodactylus gundi]
MSFQLHKVQQDLHDHQKQGGYDLPGNCLEQGHKELAVPETPETPRPLASGTSRESLAFEDIRASCSSEWWQPPPKTKDHPEPRPSRDTAEPQFWRDVLLKELWELSVKKAAVQSPATTELEPEPGLEREDPELWVSDTEPGLEDTSDSFPGEGDSASLEDDGDDGDPGQQEPVRRSHGFVKPIVWDREDIRDACTGLNAVLGRSKWLALPRALQKKRVLRHGELVLATAVSSFTRLAFTCSRSGLKVWSLVGHVVEDRHPESHLHWPLQVPGAYLRTCLLSRDSRLLFTGGHSLPGVSVWDLAASSLYERDQLPCKSDSCQALACNLSDNLIFGGFSDGTVRLWDLRNASVVRDLASTEGGVSCIAVRDHSVWTGGPDARLQCWDLRTHHVVQEHPFDSQIMSLGLNPRDEALLVGLGNGQQWLHYTKAQESPARVARQKDGTVMGLKFSLYGCWWVSVGTDNLVTIHSVPTGTTVCQIPEKSSVTCCDVSADSRLIVTGSRDCGSVYQVIY